MYIVRMQWMCKQPLSEDNQSSDSQDYQPLMIGENGEEWILQYVCLFLSRTICVFMAFFLIGLKSAHVGSQNIPHNTQNVFLSFKKKTRELSNYISQIGINVIFYPTKSTFPMPLTIKKTPTQPFSPFFFYDKLVAFFFSIHG